jgi:hypothetical protein
MERAEMIGMLHVPINTLIAAPAQWRSSLGLPALTHQEWKFLAELSRSPIDNPAAGPALETVRNLSFWQPLFQTPDRRQALR